MFSRPSSTRRVAPNTSHSSSSVFTDTITNFNNQKLHKKIVT
jgi:hypothetical protein